MKKENYMEVNTYYGTNNARKTHGLPLWRKKDKRKRFYTRNEAEEALEAFWYYCENWQEALAQLN